MKDKIINISKFYFKNFEAIIYNICSLFFIIINMLIPLYTDEIIYFNSIIIHNITINYKFNNEKKRNHFNLFMLNLIDKNNDIIAKIQKKNFDNENINNYSLDCDNEYSSDSYTDSDSDSDSDNKIIESSSSDILNDKICYTLNKNGSNESLNDGRLFKFDDDYKNFIDNNSDLKKEN